MKFPSCKSTLLLSLFVIILPDVLIAALAQHAVKKEGHHMPSEVESPDNGASGTTLSPSSGSTPTPPGGSTNVTYAPPVSSSVPSMTDQSSPLDPSSPSKQFSKTCLVNISGCGANEECVAVNSRARQGVCACERGFVRDATGACSLKAIEGISETTVPVVTSTTTSSQTSSAFSQRLLATMNSTSTVTEPTTSSTTTTTTPVPIQRLIVNATSKTAQLPFEEVTLSAFAMPPPSVDVDPHGYEYDWRLTGSVPGGNDAKGTIADTHKATLRLANLKPGTYSFVVSVKGAHSFGEAAANLTVLPPKRINTPPVVLVEPAEQTLRLPSNTALIDGSRSTDDDKIVSYKWTLETGPLGYSLSSANGEDSSGMLKLVNLTVGDYTLKLTVVDSDGASNSTPAHVRVDKEIDYPPIANAGEDSIVHLPTSSVVLDASKGSTDDRGIVTWEWTRGEGADLAVDMQNTHSPVLQLSGLVEGVYSFILRVMDAANQTATDEVRVFVKPPDTSMVADAGKNMTITLPVNEILLDGSASDKSGGSLVQSWNWTQISGPSQAVLESPYAAKTKVKSLTKGDYLFNLTVSDGTNFSWATVAVSVLQTENAPPKASAGPDISITLPCREVRLDGTASTDDVGIVRWEWTRLEGSLAAGTVVGDSASQPILRLVDLLPGHYEFTLKVYDGQGGSSEDTASLIVKPNPNELGEVELILNANLESLTTGELRTLTNKLELLLESGADSSGVTVAVVKLYPERRTKRAVLRFIAVTRGAAGGGNEGEKETVLPGGKVAVLLRNRLKRDANLLNYDVLLVESVLCQNDCSGVGQCDQETRACRCDPFWTENPIRKHFWDMESNCDWSLVYVGIISIFLTVGLALVCVGVRKAYVKRRMKSSSAHGAREDGVSNGKSGGTKRTKHRYSLLNGFGGGRRRKRHAANGGEEMTSLTRSFDSSLMVSDSDSGSEVLFQARRSTPSTVLNGHHKTPAESSESMNGALVNLTPPVANGFPPASPSIDEPEVVVSNGGSVAYHRPRSDDEESLNLIA